ncbi:MAG: hypothetical protein KDA61_22090 [Planctomycetales bacterium]|nr:hypothetical protein [Planctomycetales bacterium]
MRPIVAAPTSGIRTAAHVARCEMLHRPRDAFTGMIHVGEALPAGSRIEAANSFDATK